MQELDEIESFLLMLVGKSLQQGGNCLKIRGGIPRGFSPGNLSCETVPFFIRIDADCPAQFIPCLNNFRIAFFIAGNCFRGKTGQVRYTLQLYFPGHALPVQIPAKGFIEMMINVCHR